MINDQVEVARDTQYSGNTVFESDFSKLVGRTLTGIVVGEESSFIEFHTQEGDVYVMWHIQDCCECVWLEDVVGDLKDLLGSPVVVARLASEGRNKGGEWDAVEGWAFYQIATQRGWVTLRWNESSNGYYSTEVDLDHIPAGHNLPAVVGVVSKG